MGLLTRTKTYHHHDLLARPGASGQPPSTSVHPPHVATRYDVTDKKPALILHGPKYSVLNGYRRSPLTRMIKRPEMSSCSLKRRDTLTASQGPAGGPRAYGNNGLAKDNDEDVSAKSGRSTLASSEKENTRRLPNLMASSSSTDPQKPPALVKTPPCNNPVRLPEYKPIDPRPKRIKLALERKIFSDFKSSSKLAGKLGALSPDPFLHQKLLNKHKAHWTPSIKSQPLKFNSSYPLYAGRGTPSMPVLPRPALVPRPRVPASFTVPSADPRVPPTTTQRPAEVLRLHRLALDELPKKFDGRTTQAFKPELILLWKFQSMSMDMDVDEPEDFAQAGENDPDVQMEIVEPEDEVAAGAEEKKDEAEPRESEPAKKDDAAEEKDDAAEKKDDAAEEKDNAAEEDNAAEKANVVEKDNAAGSKDGRGQEKKDVLEETKSKAEKENTTEENDGEPQLAEVPGENPDIVREAAPDHNKGDTTEQTEPQSEGACEAGVQLEAASEAADVPGVALRPVDLPDLPNHIDDQVKKPADSAERGELAAPDDAEEETPSDDFHGRETLLLLPPVDEYRPFYNPLPWQESLLLGPIEVKRDEPLRSAPPVPWFESLLFSVDSE
ncbi:hypothetical protein BV20DRAFT_731540 [Pilatotrama ljubarskyi]|nr:hypothetical protein BV20DRAFT_731540 [Pilatotrama ljubarskyi]